jgi:hypothetical protein
MILVAYLQVLKHSTLIVIKNAIKLWQELIAVFAKPVDNLVLVFMLTLQISFTAYKILT